MAIFRIAHISDLHFSTTQDHLNPLETETAFLDRANKALRVICRTGKSESITYPSTFETLAALRLLRELAALDLDGIVVTGDLATTGRVADLEIAKNYFAGQVPTAWRSNFDDSLPSLLRDGMPILTLPGNHDRYEGSANLPGSLNFEQVFGSEWDLKRGYSEPVGTSNKVRLARFKRGNTTLAVLLIDLSLTDRTAAEGGILNYVGQGKATKDPLNAAEATTTTLYSEYRLRKEPLVVIWAVHFPPGFPGVPRELELIDAPALLQSLWRTNVQFVLAGHTHEHKVYPMQSPSNAAQSVHVFCCGATTGVSAHGKLSYSVLEIDAVGPTELQLRTKKYSWNGEAFVS